MEITRELCEKRIAEQEQYLLELGGRKGRVETNQLDEYRKSAESRLQFFKDKKSELEKSAAHQL